MLLIFILIYLLLTLAIGLFASKKTTLSEDYLLAGRRLPFHLSLSAFFATWFGAETILGASAQFAQHGYKGMIEDPLGASLCLLLVGLFFVKHFYSKGYLSIGDFFKKVYGPKFEFLASFVQFISYFTYSAAQFVALGLVLESITNLSFETCLVSSSIVVLLYTYAGGMWALAITDFVQSIVIIFGLLFMTYFLVNQFEGEINLENLIPNQKTSFLPDTGFNNWAIFITSWMVMGFGSIPSQDIFQRILSAKSEKIARYSAIGAGILYFTIACFPLLIVMLCIKLYGISSNEDYQKIIPNAVLSHMPLFIQILFFGALLSAILSTASASLLAQATVLSENLIKPQFKHLTEKQFLKTIKGSVVFVALTSIAIALRFNSVFELATYSSCIILVSLFSPMFFGIILKQPSLIAALISLFMGTFTFLTLNWFHFGMLSLFWGFLASILPFLVASLFKCFIKKNRIPSPRSF